MQMKQWTFSTSCGSIQQASEISLAERWTNLRTAIAHFIPFVLGVCGLGKQVANYKMASPSDLGPAFWEFRELFLVYGWETLWRTVVGANIGLVGLFFGMIMGFSRLILRHYIPSGRFNAIPFQLSSQLLLWFCRTT